MKLLTKIIQIVTIAVTLLKTLVETLEKEPKQLKK